MIIASNMEQTGKIALSFAKTPHEAILIRVNLNDDSESWVSFAKTPRRLNFIHVTCYMASLYVVDFKRALNFVEAQGKAAVWSTLPRLSDGT
jgi:hypothetical protein